jgi:hypothetical protein
VLPVFDVLRLDGRSTRRPPYRDRRMLLDELALDGPAWRTPWSIDHRTLAARSDYFRMAFHRSVSATLDPPGFLLPGAGDSRLTTRTHFWCLPGPCLGLRGLVTRPTEQRCARIALRAAASDLPLTLGTVQTGRGRGVRFGAGVPGGVGEGAGGGGGVAAAIVTECETEAVWLTLSVTVRVTV